MLVYLRVDVLFMFFVQSDVFSKHQIVRKFRVIGFFFEPVICFQWNMDDE